MRAVQPHAEVGVTLSPVAVGAGPSAVDSTVQTEPLPPLHERYPLQRIRVLRQGKPSTLCLEWPTYFKLLSMTPGRRPRALSRVFREEVERLERGGRVNGLSAKAREAVRLRLQEARTARQGA